jgi:hypothetical protein
VGEVPALGDPAPTQKFRPASAKHARHDVCIEPLQPIQRGEELKMS